MTPINGLAGYPGSKAAAGVCETIIRQMPPHRVYYEPFAGHVAVARRKRHAERTVLCDVDDLVIDALKRHLAGWQPGRLAIYKEDGRSVARFNEDMHAADALFYFDPPYLLKTRTRVLYRCELETEEEHAELLTLLLRMRAMVMISGYWSELYAEMLRGWRCLKYMAMTRGGLKEECLWCNFPEPTKLHDPAFAGRNFRERERIKRKKQRWARMFADMPPLERQAVAEALAECDRTSTAAPLPAVAAVAGEAASPGWQQVEGPLGNGGLSS